MESFDLLLGIVYVFVILFFGIYYANRKFSQSPGLKKTFLVSLFLKLSSGIVFGCVYLFYYKYGDCLNYLTAGKEYFNYVVEKPSALIDFIFLDQKILTSKYKDLIEHSAIVGDYFIDSNILVHKAVLFLGIFCGYLFFPLCVFFSLISFVGCWQIYRTLSKLYPQYSNYFKISFLYIPSVVFWTAGIGKDAICIGCINLFASLLIESFIFKRHVIKYTIISLFLLYVTYTIKSYIVLSFVPMFIFFVFSFRLKKIEKQAKKVLIKLAFFSISSVIVVALLFASSFTEKFTEDIVSSALSLTQGQLNSESINDSKYDLGITLDDIRSRNIKPFIIPSIVVAFYRPYIWEVNKPIIVFSFVESCFFLFFTLYVFIKGYVIRTIQIIAKNEFVLFCIIYSIIFAFFVGLVSANFGTLIRYKTPFISYFLIALFIIKDTLSAKRKTIVPDTNNFQNSTN